MTTPKSPMARADFFTGILLFMLGAYLLVEGLRMPGAGGYIEAGESREVPVMLGVIIALLALILVVRALRAGARQRWQDGERTVVDSDGVVRGVLTAVWCGCYALAMLGFTTGGWQFTYRGATVLFLLVFIVGFEWGNAKDLGARRWAWLGQAFPSIARLLQPLSRMPGARFGSYLWLICVASAQALVATWVIAWLFEQKFYVQLP